MFCNITSRDSESSKGRKLLLFSTCLPIWVCVATNQTEDMFCSVDHRISGYEYFGRICMQVEFEDVRGTTTVSYLNPNRLTLALPPYLSRMYGMPYIRHIVTVVRSTFVARYQPCSATLLRICIFGKWICFVLKLNGLSLFLCNREHGLPGYIALKRLRVSQNTSTFLRNLIPTDWIN